MEDNPYPSYKDPFTDVDFKDVFGGPPPRRHSSIYEHRRRPSPADSFDQALPPLSQRRHWSGPGEKLPAFGGESGRRSSSSRSRRRNFGDEFFSDIFPGSDSNGSTPVRVESDVLMMSSTPGSLVHSPIRAGGIRYEPVSGAGSPLPARVSLSTKLRSDEALSESYSFPSSPAASVSSSTTNLRNDTHPSLYRPPSSSSRLGSYNIKNDTKKSAGSASLDSHANANMSNFHFSFYRWAGKGVIIKLQNRLSRDDDDVDGDGEDLSVITTLPEVVIQGVDLLSDYEDDNSMSTATGTSKGPIEIERMDDDMINTVKMEDLEKESLRSDITIESGPSTQREELQSTAESKPRVKNNLKQLMGHYGEPGQRYVDLQVEENDEVKTKQHSAISEEKILGKKVKVKVRDFIKRFGSEGSPKRDQKMRKKEKIKIRGEGQAPLSPSLSEMNKEERSTELKTKEAFVFASPQLPEINEAQGKIQEKVSGSYGEEKSTKLKTEEAFAFAFSPSPQIHEVQQKEQEQVFDFSSSSKKTSDYSSEINQTVQPTSVEPMHEVQPESDIEDFEECLVEYTVEEQSVSLNSSADQDDIKISEAKIREWSRGKEGNIRSLLSTLQHVLWPGSGWKPVPLVSIIEVAGVRRAYQRALLCLHPDKLQQRGAAPHEKYIAEKVFKILQDAWNEFSL